MSKTPDDQTLMPDEPRGETTVEPLATSAPPATAGTLAVPSPDATMAVPSQGPFTALPDDDVTFAGASHIPAAAGRPSDTIGPYQLMRQLGVGGMGEVWLAEQTRPVKRKVALKVIKMGMDTAAVVERFEAERQALAMMDHPAIAHVYEAGATPQGRPYFAMEYAEGEPIASYCLDRKLSVRDRLDLFLKVCEGVQHAHQKGIIHRDLKPSNVMVTLQDGKPVPKIIDFGVAKATSAEAKTDIKLHTIEGSFIGTPEYMSPEQAAGQLDIDTRADVYALGVILYELLTGTLPFDSKTLRGQGLDELRRTIAERDPERPSTRISTVSKVAGASSVLVASAQRLISQLRGDLDWITMKALEKDRARRYGSASDLAADIRRHLAFEPVLAGPPSKVYKLKKFARRHRAGVAAASVVLALLVAFAITMTVQAQRIARERDRANREAERANREAIAATQVSDFLKGLFNVSDPSESRGNTLTAREILDTGADRIRRELSSQPEVQARLMDTMGGVYTSLGLYRAAERLLKEAAQTSSTTVGPDHPQSLAALNRLANAMWYQDRFDEAEPLYKDVVERSTRVLGAEDPATLRARTDLSSNYAQQQRFVEAEQLEKETLSIQLRVHGPQHLDTQRSRNVLQSVYFQQGRYEEAGRLVQDIVDVSRAVLGDDHPDTLTDMHNLATVQDRLARYAEAEAIYTRVIAGKSKVLGPVHPSTVRSIQRLSTMLQRQKRYRDAETQLLSVFATLEQSEPSTTSPTPDTSVVDGVIKQLVALYEVWGQTGKAAQWRGRLGR